MHGELAVYGKYFRQLTGTWRATYIVAALVSPFVNVVVLSVQSFQKIPALHALAPTQSGPIFLAVQGITLIAFIAIGFLDISRPSSARQADATNGRYRIPSSLAKPFSWHRDGFAVFCCC